MTPAALRRLTHAGSACVLLPSLFLAGPTYKLLVTAAAMGWVALEVIRIRVAPFHAWLSATVPVYREHEARRLSGAAWLMIGYGMAVWTPGGVSAGILVAALADPIASAVGSRFGDASRKTLAGSAAFFTAAAGVLVMVGLGWSTAFGIALIASVLERWPLGLNDNLVLPPSVAWMVWGLA